MIDVEQYLPNDAALRGMCLKDGLWNVRYQAMAREILRLRAELAKASAEVQRLEGQNKALARLTDFGPCSDGWRYGIASIGWHGSAYVPCRISVRRTHTNGRSEVVDFLPASQVTEAAKDAPPADVLGEALRRSVFLATPGKGLPLGSRDGCLLGESVDAAKFRHLHAAVSELAQVVERIARQQGGGK